MSTSLETHEQAVSRVQSELSNDLKSLTRSQIRQLAECFPSCGQRKFMETLQERLAEAQSENLNLNQYAKQSQPVVLLYWCCARDKEHFDDKIKNTWLVTESGDEQPPIETCLQEIEDTPKLSKQLSRQLRKLARIKDESCCAMEGPHRNCHAKVCSSTTRICDWRRNTQLGTPRIF